MPVDLWRDEGQFLEPCVVWTRVYDEFRCIFPRERANKDVTAARAREDIRKDFGGITIYSHPSCHESWSFTVPNHSQKMQFVFLWIQPATVQALVLDCHPRKNNQEARIAEIRAQAETRTFAAYRYMPLVQLGTIHWCSLVPSTFQAWVGEKDARRGKHEVPAILEVASSYLVIAYDSHYTKSHMFCHILSHQCYSANKSHRHPGSPTSRTSLYTTRAQGPSSHWAAAIDGRSIAGEPRRCQECSKTSFKDSGQKLWWLFLFLKTHEAVMGWSCMMF